MTCPFLEEPVDIDSQILCRNLCWEKVIRPRLDVSSFPDDYLFENYRFSAQLIIYLNNILSPHIVHMTHRGHALYITTSIITAEHIPKATICRAVRNALKRLLYTFVVFPSHRPTRLVKEEFHRIVDIRFPGMIGCIDGTITAPSVNEGDYVNRKSFHSINVQMKDTSQHSYCSNVEANWSGSVHDSRIFCECTLSARFASVTTVLDPGRLRCGSTGPLRLLSGVVLPRSPSGAPRGPLPRMQPCPQHLLLQLHTPPHRQESETDGAEPPGLLLLFFIVAG
ncbi:HARB1 nuclease, partial [Amia calva]|nr:HARB1 nuclease [Amia calva]